MGRVALKNIHDLIGKTATVNQVKENGVIVRTRKPQLPYETIFLNSLENTIVKINTKPNYTSKCYKPSSLKCERNMYYQVQGISCGDVIDTPTAALVGIGESGTHRHDDIQGYICEMKNNGYDWEYLDVSEFIKERNLTDLEVKRQKGHETKVYNKKLNMTFMTDGLLRYKNNNGEEKYFIFEAKTETARKFQDRNGVDPSHYNQGIAYSINFGLDEVIFLYENRDTCEKKAFLFVVTDEMRKGLLDKINRVEKFRLTNTLPPKTEEKRICFYCPYKEICKVDKNS